MATLLAVAAITLLRVAWLAAGEPNLYADEAQYWVWAQELRLGYYSKPPLIAWAIAATTAICGDAEGCVRLASPLCHAATALLLGAAARRLFENERIGFWTAVVYATLPAVSVSAAIASTDAPLLTAWAAGLYALVRLSEAPALRWWALVGAAIGLGLLAKYAMAGFVASLLLWLAFDRTARPLARGRGPWLAAALALLIVAPNLAWNLAHGFATVRHVGENTDLAGGVRLDPLRAAEFLAAQFGVFGPLTFAALLWVLGRPATWRDARTRLLALFIVPFGAAMLLQAFLARANANWAAPIYAAGTILVVRALVQPQPAPAAPSAARGDEPPRRQGRAAQRLLRLAVALHVAAAVVLFLGPPAATAAGFDLPRRADPWMRQRGWDALGQAIARAAAPHADARFLFEQRRDMASLIYYIRPHPLDARMWTPGRPGNEFQLSAPLTAADSGPFLFVSRRADPADVLARFERAELIARLTVPTHRDAALRYTLWRLEGFRGYGG